MIKSALHYTVSASLYASCTIAISTINAVVVSAVIASLGIAFIPAYIAILVTRRAVER